MKLNEHPDKLQLMRMAFTYQVGRNEGEEALKLNPKFKALMEKE